MSFAGGLLDAMFKRLKVRAKRGERDVIGLVATDDTCVASVRRRPRSTGSDASVGGRL